MNDDEIRQLERQQNEQREALENFKLDILLDGLAEFIKAVMTDASNNQASYYTPDIYSAKRSLKELIKNQNAN